jgi:hypothetical protein
MSALKSTWDKNHEEIGVAIGEAMCMTFMSNFRSLVKN